VAKRILIDRTEHALRRAAGNLDIRRQFHELNTLDVPQLEEEFWGDAVDARWQTGLSNGSSAAALAIVAARNGTATLITGTDDNGYASASHSLSWGGDLHR